MYVYALKGTIFYLISNKPQNWMFGTPYFCIWIIRELRTIHRIDNPRGDGSVVINAPQILYLSLCFHESIQLMCVTIKKVKQTNN